MTQPMSELDLYLTATKIEALREQEREAQAARKALEARLVEATANQLTGEGSCTIELLEGAKLKLARRVKRTLCESSYELWVQSLDGQTRQRLPVNERTSKSLDVRAFRALCVSDPGLANSLREHIEEQEQAVEVKVFF